jgi:hypothetical protein
MPEVSNQPVVPGSAALHANIGEPENAGSAPPVTRAGPVSARNGIRRTASLPALGRAADAGNGPDGSGAQPGAENAGGARDGRGLNGLPALAHRPDPADHPPRNNKEMKQRFSGPDDKDNDYLQGRRELMAKENDIKLEVARMDAQKKMVEEIAKAIKDLGKAFSNHHGH